MVTGSWRNRLSNSILISATLLTVCGSVAHSQDARLSAVPTKVEGKRVGVAILKDAPRSVPAALQLEGEIDDTEFTMTDREQQALKAAVYARIKAAALPQAAAPALASPSTLSPLLSFMPTQTIDEVNCGNNNRAPDAALAVSPTYLVEVNNSCLKVLNPSTGAVIAGPTALGTFFGIGGYILDVRALYDAANGRFIVSAEDQTLNEVVVAASQSSNPTLGWNVYSFAMGLSCGGAGDFPMLGQTNQEPGDPKGAIYLSWNSYCSVGGYTNFVGAISKTSAYSGAAIPSISGFSSLSESGAWVDSVQPANIMNPSDHPRGEFLVNSFNYHFGGGHCSSGCNGIVVWFLQNGIPASGASQSISGIVVPTATEYYLPTNAPQPGCAVNTCGPNAGLTIASGEVTYSAGSLFAAISDAMGILILEVQPFVNASGTITGALKRNEICFACGGFSNGGAAYYGTIQPDSERNFLMVYNYSVPGTTGCTPNATSCVYPSVAFLTHRVTQAQNTLDGSGSAVVFALGQAYFSQIGTNGTNRFGDYNAAAPNYTAPNSFWFDGEFVESTGNWGRAVGETGYTSITQP